MIADPALVIVDLQNDFCSEWDEEHGKFELRSDFEPTIRATREFLDRYRESGRTPIFLGAEHSDYTLSETWSQRYDRPQGMSCRSGSDGAEFVSELDVRQSDVTVRKHRYNGFYKTDLEQYLSTNEISTILFGGVATNVCVLATILGAYDRDYDVTLLSDCSGSKESESHLHEMTLENVEKHFGSIKRSSEVSLEPVKKATKQPTDL